MPHPPGHRGTLVPVDLLGLQGMGQFERLQQAAWTERWETLVRTVAQCGPGAVTEGSRRQEQLGRIQIGQTCYVRGRPSLRVCRLPIPAVFVAARIRACWVSDSCPGSQQGDSRT